MKTIKLLLPLLLLTVITFGQTKKDVAWRQMGNNKSVSFKEVQDNFYQYWKDKTPKKGQGYKIFKRWENQANDRLYPSGNLELLSSTYSNYMQWESGYKAKQNKSLDKNGIVQPEPILDFSNRFNIKNTLNTTSSTTSLGSWTLLGPVNSATTSYSGIGNHGGYVFLNRIDPKNT